MYKACWSVHKAVFKGLVIHPFCVRCPCPIQLCFFEGVVQKRHTHSLHSRLYMSPYARMTPLPSRNHTRPPRALASNCLTYKKFEIETAKTNCRNRKLDHSRAETFEILMLFYPVLAKRYYTHNLLIMDCKASASNLSICDISARSLWQPIARVRKRRV